MKGIFFCKKMYVSVLFSIFFFTLFLGGCSKLLSGKSNKYLPNCILELQEKSNSRDIDDSVAQFICTLIETELSQRKDIVILDRSIVEATKKEQSFGASDWSSHEKLFELGEALNASYSIFITVYDYYYVVEFGNMHTLQKRSVSGTFRISKTAGVEKVRKINNLKKIRKIKFYK